MTAREPPEYVVLGPGWGAEYLPPVGPTGRIAYRGYDLDRARRELARCHREVEQLRRQPGMQNVSDTYRLMVWSDGARGWVVVGADEDEL